MNNYVHVKYLKYFNMTHAYRADIGLAPGRKRAYMLYKAALSDATAASSQDSNSDGTGLAPLNPNAPHPYVLALGVISVQKVCIYTMYTV